MRYAILSDIHSNLEALQVVLDYLKTENIDRYLCLGDIVGYGANPNECIELIKNNYKFYCILGNHDAIMVNKHNLTYYNPYAKKCLEWTSQQLTEQNKNFLNSLEFTKIIDNIQLIHSSPSKPTEWEYMLSLEDVEYNINYITQSILFFGHTHKAAIYIQDLKTNNLMTYNSPVETLEIDLQNYRYIINVGSVGQPRDGNPKSSFGIYDSSKQELKIIKLPYDNRTACQKILNVGLPGLIAHRLLVGQ